MSTVDIESIIIINGSEFSFTSGETVKQDMARSPKISSKERIKDFIEMELGFDIKTVKRECGRCLRCDVKID
jgi:hypothetical protein